MQWKQDDTNKNGYIFSMGDLGDIVILLHPTEGEAYTYWEGLNGETIYPLGPAEGGLPEAKAYIHLELSRLYEALGKALPELQAKWEGDAG